MMTGVTAGLVWLCDEITRRGLGWGLSLVFFAGLAVGLSGAVGAIEDQLQTGHLGAGDLAVFVGGLVVSSALVLLVDPARWGRSMGGGVSG